MPKRRLTAQLLEERRGVAHVLRRLSMGPQTGLIAGLRDTDAPEVPKSRPGRRQ